MPLTREEIPRIEEIMTLLNEVPIYLYKFDLVKETDWKNFRPEYGLNQHGFADFEDKQTNEPESEDEYER